MLEVRNASIREQVHRPTAGIRHKVSAYGGTFVMSLTLNSQNKREAQGQHVPTLNLLSRHRSDAQVALQQSLILQSDNEKLTKV